MSCKPGVFPLRFAAVMVRNRIRAERGAMRNGYLKEGQIAAAKALFLAGDNTGSAQDRGAGGRVMRFLSKLLSYSSKGGDMPDASAKAVHSTERQKTSPDGFHSFRQQGHNEGPSATKTKGQTPERISALDWMQGRSSVWRFFPRSVVQPRGVSSGSRCWQSAGCFFDLSEVPGAAPGRGRGATPPRSSGSLVITRLQRLLVPLCTQLTRCMDRDAFHPMASCRMPCNSLTVAAVVTSARRQIIGLI